jgi:hypothetical protein
MIRQAARERRDGGKSADQGIARRRVGQPWSRLASLITGYRATTSGMGEPDR